MKVNIRDTTIGQIMEVELNANETINTEVGALVSALGEIEVKSEIGSFMSGALRMLGGGESAFINKITANQNNTKLQLGTDLSGEIREIKLENETYLLGDGAYLAHTGNIEISAKLGGFKSLIAGSGFMFLTAKGTGNLYVAGAESMFEKEIKPGETFYVDNTCLVAIKEGVRMEKLLMGKNMFTKLVGGEGFMFKIHGPAKVLYQTQSPSAIARAIAKFFTKG